jgi:hypothetical protein
MEYKTPATFHANLNMEKLLTFFNAFILWNNEAVELFCDLWHTLFHVLRRPRPQDAETPLLLLLQILNYL